MGNSSIKDHIARYRVLLKKSQVPEDSPSAIDYFRKTLNYLLQRDLLKLPTPPKDLKEWYEWASRLDNNFHKLQQILGRNTTKLKEEPRRRWNFQKKDPDALSTERRMEMMKKGLCFGCGKEGHLSRDCEEKKEKPTASPYSPPTYAPPKKMTQKELYTHVRSLTAQMDDVIGTPADISRDGLDLDTDQIR